MKKTIITISILLIITLLFAFALKPSEDNQKKIINVGKMNLQSFDIYEVLRQITVAKPENLNLFFEDFSMTVTNKKNIISLNFSFIEEQAIRDKKTNVHLYGVNDKLIVKTDLLDDGRDFSIKEYIFSIFNIGNTRSKRSRLYAKDYLHQDELSDLLTNLKQTFIDDIDREKEQLHIELLFRAYYTINNYNDIEIYLVNTTAGDITNIKEISNHHSIEPIFEDDNIKGYKINNLKGICSYTNGSAGKLKYYFLDEN